MRLCDPFLVTQAFIYDFQVAVIEVELKFIIVRQIWRKIRKEEGFHFCFTFAFEKAFRAETSSRTLHLRRPYCKIRNVQGHQFPM